MKVLITGSNGFIGKHLLLSLEGEATLIPYDKEHGIGYLDVILSDVDFIFHLASNIKDKFEENTELTQHIIDKLTKYNRFPPILFTSSIRIGTEYADNKRTIEQILIDNYKGEKYIYRLSNVFGKWCRPNYNNVVATFIFNTLHGLELKVNDPDAIVQLVYIDDVVTEFKKVLRGETINNPINEVTPVYKLTVGELAGIIRSFTQNKQLIDKLYKTYKG